MFLAREKLHVAWRLESDVVTSIQVAIQTRQLVGA